MAKTPVVVEARKRGWLVEAKPGGHLKLTHPKIPGEEIVASRSPSDHRAVKNCLARMKKAEAAAGIVIEQHGRGKKIEPFKFIRLSDHRLRYTVECKSCPSTAKWTSRIPGAQPPVARSLRQTFEKDGWHIGLRRASDICPTCLEEVPDGLPPLPEVPKEDPVSLIPFVVALPAPARKWLEQALASGLYGFTSEEVLQNMALTQLRDFAVRSKHFAAHADKGPQAPWEHRLRTSANGVNEPSRPQ